MTATPTPAAAESTPAAAGPRERILQSVVVEVTGCWIWRGSMHPRGYGAIHLLGVGPRLAHRISYEAFVGPIPEGLVIDHLCRVKACVNPQHLEPVTTRENVLRGIGLSARRSRQTRCIRGHDFTPENTYRASDGRRYCRTCRKRAKAEFDARRRQERANAQE